MMNSILDWLGVNWSVVVSTLTAVFTAWILYKQFKLQKDQLLTQQKEHQPLFHFDDGVEAFKIINQGDLMSTPAKIEIKTLLKADSVYDNNGTKERHLSCIPIEYYEHIHFTHNFTGCLVECVRHSQDCYDLLEDLICRVKKGLKSKDRPYRISDNNKYLSITLGDLVKISYTDLYGKPRCICFWNHNVIPEVEYHQLEEATHVDSIFLCTAYPLGILTEEFIIGQFAQEKLIVGIYKD